MPTYDVKFADGHTQTFSAPVDLSDADAFTRATQERAIAEGRIPTTWWSGAAKHLGEDKATTGSLITAAGMGTQAVGAAAASVTGGASLALLPVGQAMMTSAPVASNLIDYGTRRATGQNPDAPTPIALARDAAVGAAGAYGPQVAGKAARLAASHMPTTGVGGAIMKLLGVGPIAEGVEQAAQPVGHVLKGQTVKDVAAGVADAALKAKTGISAREVARVSSHIADGMDPSKALRLVSGNDPAKLKALTTQWIRTRLAAVKP